MRAFMRIIGVLLALLGIGWLGFRVKPAGPQAHMEQSRDLGVVALPADLPPPVRRHFEQTGGSRVPLMESAVVWGRGRIKPFGFWVPLTFRAYYVPGQSMERTIQMTWFGLPVLTGIDSYRNGEGTFTLTGLGGLLKQEASGEKYAQGGNLALWGEASWMASVFATDPRVRWEAIDDTHARLVVPLGTGDDSLLVSFDPETGLLARMEALRYRDDESEKTPWHGDSRDRRAIDGVYVPSILTATWEDQSGPYVELNIEGLAYNVDVSDRLPVAR